MELDHTDRAILTLMQADASLSHAEVGERVGVSAASAWRRAVVRGGRGAWHSSWDDRDGSGDGDAEAFDGSR